MSSVRKGFSYLYFLHKTAIKLIDSDSNLKAVDLAKALHIRPNTAGDWIHIYKSEGPRALLNREPGRRKLTVVQINSIRDALKRSPKERGFNEESWNIELVRQLIIREHGVTYSNNDTLYRTLKRHGLVLERKNKSKEYKEQVAQLIEITSWAKPSDYGLEGQWTVDNIFLVARVHLDIPLTKIPIYKRLRTQGWTPESEKKSKTAT